MLAVPSPDVRFGIAPTKLGLCEGRALPVIAMVIVQNRIFVDDLQFAHAGHHDMRLELAF